MKRCEITGKGITFGHNITFAHNMNKRIWKPNLQTVKVEINGQMTKVKVDVKTLRALKAADSVEVARILKKNEATLSPRIRKILAK
jgi:large subunit ribosomal protein L28